SPGSVLAMPLGDRSIGGYGQGLRPLPQTSDGGLHARTSPRVEQPGFRSCGGGARHTILITILSQPPRPLDFAARECPASVGAIGRDGAGIGGRRGATVTRDSERTGGGAVAQCGGGE